MYKKLLICILFLAFFASNVMAAQINLTDKKNASTPGTYYFKDMVGDIDTNTTELYAGDAASVKLTEDNTLTGSNIIGKLLNIILSDGSETMTTSTFAWTANHTWDIGDYNAQSVNESVVDVNGYVAPKITYQALPPTKDQADGMYIAPVDTAQSRMYAKKSTGYTNISDGGFTFFAPEIESLNVNGTDLTIVFTEAMTQGSAWTEDLFTIDASVTGNSIGMDVDSGDTTDTWLATLDSAMVPTDVVTFDFTGAADSVESSTGDDLAAIDSLAVVNNTVGISCTGAFGTDVENFEAAAGGDFCTTGLTETDSGNLIITNSTDQYVSGTKSLKYSGSGTSYVEYDNGSTDGDWSNSFAFRTPSAVTTANLYLSQTAITGLNAGITSSLYYTTDGYVQIVSGSTATVETALSNNTWYFIEVDYNQGASSTLKVYQNNAGVKGAQVGSTANFTGDSDAPRYFFWGVLTNPSTTEFYIDALSMDMGGL